VSDVELLIKELTLAGYDTGLTRTEDGEEGEVAITHPSGAKAMGHIVRKGDRYYTWMGLGESYFLPVLQPSFEEAAERLSEALRKFGKDGWT
jgi:hypothetical protein